MEMNVYVWYDVISMFVNDVVCDRDIVSSGKEIPVLRLLGRALFGDSIYLRRYPDSHTRKEIKISFYNYFSPSPKLNQ